MSSHGVNDEENFIRFDGLSHLLQLIHERLVDMKAAGRIDEHVVMMLLFRPLERLFGC